MQQHRSGQLTRLPAVLLYQTIPLNRLLTEDAVVEVVDRIVMPLLAP